MVKMAAGVVIFCQALLLVLSSVSAVQRLDSINDLKKINFGQSVPKQGLVLLHWFANTVDINSDGIYLTFDPNNDYGSHHYGNYDGLLGNLRDNRYRYYTVGNIRTETRRPLPNHIVNPQTTDLGGNRARIIFRVREQNARRQSRQVIDEVYMTQHHGHSGTEYDGQHTYRITTNLLRQIRSFPMNGDHNSLRNLRDHYGSNVDDNQLHNIQHQWDGLACLGLLLFIVLSRVNVNQYSTVTGYSSVRYGNSWGQSRTDTQSRWNPDTRSRWDPDTWSFCDWITNFLKLIFILLVIFVIFIIFVVSVSMKKY